MKNLFIVLALFPPKVETVDEVSFSYRTPPVSPEYRSQEKLVINGDLSTHWVRTDSKGKKELAGKITPEQLAVLKQKIASSNYMNVKVTERRPGMVGCSSKGISIKTNIGRRGFNDDCFAGFPIH